MLSIQQYINLLQIIISRQNQENVVGEKKFSPNFSAASFLTSYKIKSETVIEQFRIFCFYTLFFFSEEKNNVSFSEKEFNKRKISRLTAIIWTIILLISHPFARVSHLFASIRRPFARVSHPFARVSHPFAWVSHPFTRVSHPFTGIVVQIIAAGRP